ncbi:MAG: hypothetical protein NT154_05500, partial [Verrucomicrobia bacterium]|nr:hypothetical protein [Verrucomicrobiota bacterium]
LISDVKTNDAGTYSVLVKNSVGSVPSGNAILNVTPAPTYATYRQAVLADQPIHYYPLDDTNGTVAADLGSLATTGGTYTGGFTLGQSSGISGHGTCVRFDGKPGTYVDLGLFHPGDSVSAEAWVNLDPNAQRDPSYYDIVGRIAGGGPQGSWILGLASGYLVNFAAVNDSGVMVQPNYPYPMARGQWHHLVGTFDAVTGAVNCYVDGQRGTEGTLSGVLQDKGPTPDRVLIGASRDGTNSSFAFLGLIDEVAIYNTGLSAAQVRAHYRASTPASLSLNIQPAVIASWPSFPPGSVLQWATNVTGPYENYPGSNYLQGTDFIAPVPVSGTSRFFRLYTP